MPRRNEKPPCILQTPRASPSPRRRHKVKANDSLSALGVGWHCPSGDVNRRLGASRRTHFHLLG